MDVEGEVPVIWTLIALVSALQIFILGLTFAPKDFWRGLAQRNQSAAYFLWGFSHLFGPFSEPGQPAWERLK